MCHRACCNKPRAKSTLMDKVCKSAFSRVCHCSALEINCAMLNCCSSLYLYMTVCHCSALEPNCTMLHCCSPPYLYMTVNSADGLLKELSSTQATNTITVWRALHFGRSVGTDNVRMERARAMYKPRHDCRRCRVSTIWQQ